MWIIDYFKALLIGFVINVLKCGPIPRHIAIIMDGNRRFAKKHKLPTTMGYKMGLEQVEKTTTLCNELGIKEISIYAFSVENFKRPEEEVNSIMKIGVDYLTSITREHAIHRIGLRLRFIGNIDLFPATVRKTVAKVELDLEKNDNITLNVMAPYTSRQEITNAIDVVVKGVRSGELEKEDISEQLISDCMYANRSSNPDLLIRTSGETRLSDFMLWQTGFTQIFFLESMWQNLSAWDVLKVIIQYQRNHGQLKEIEESVKPVTKYNARILSFLEKLEKARKMKLERIAFT